MPNRSVRDILGEHHDPGAQALPGEMAKPTVAQDWKYRRPEAGERESVPSDAEEETIELSEPVDELSEPSPLQADLGEVTELRHEADDLEEAVAEAQVRGLRREETAADVEQSKNRLEETEADIADAMTARAKGMTTRSMIPKKGEGPSRGKRTRAVTRTSQKRNPQR